MSNYKCFNSVIKSKTAGIILAGGKGTRIQKLYPDIPKPFIPVAGLPFIEWVLVYLKNQGISNFAISLGHLWEVAEEYLKKRTVGGLNICTVVENRPFGTGGGFLYAANKVSEFENYLVANGDSIVLTNLEPAFDMLSRDDTDIVIVGIKVDCATRYGSLCLGLDGKVVSFSEKVEGAGFINGGVYLIKKRVVPLFPSRQPLSFEIDIFPYLLNIGVSIRACVCNAPFIDIGTEESIKQAKQFIKTHFQRGGCV